MRSSGRRRTTRTKCGSRPSRNCGTIRLKTLAHANSFPTRCAATSIVSADGPNGRRVGQDSNLPDEESAGRRVHDRVPLERLFLTREQHMVLTKFPQWTRFLAVMAAAWGLSCLSG